jgi:hypothetical protein
MGYQKAIEKAKDDLMIDFPLANVLIVHAQNGLPKVPSNDITFSSHMEVNSPVTGTLGFDVFVVNADNIHPHNMAFELAPESLYDFQHFSMEFSLIFYLK